MKTDTNRSRANGYGVNLYRDGRHNIFGGVAAGLAAHFDIDRWIMRVLFIGALCFTGMLAFWAYVIAWVALVKKPEEIEPVYEYDENQHCYRRKNVFRYSQSASERLRKAKQRLRETTERVEEIERYVTSRKFDLDKEFSKL